MAWSDAARAAAAMARKARSTARAKGLGKSGAIKAAQHSIQGTRTALRTKEGFFPQTKRVAQRQYNLFNAALLKRPKSLATSLKNKKR